MLFSWYFKIFELLRRYFVKHPTRVDLENLNLKEVDKEMAADEASQSTGPEGDTPESAPSPPANYNPAIDAWTCYLFSSSFFFVLGAQCVLGFFNSNFRTMFLFQFKNNVFVQCLWAFIIMKQCWLPIVFGPSVISVIFILACFHSFLAWYLVTAPFR